MNTTVSTDEKQAILAAIIASTDDTIVSKTVAGIITSWNPAAERMFGYTEEDECKCLSS
jgi:PAS domain S-box-containing protein